jgi:predicted DNA-binding protein (MmcQ/YjbR family)
MNHEFVRAFCLKLPHVTEEVLWSDTLVFKVGGRMFALLNLAESRATRLAFKCDAEQFSQLTELEDVVPAPFLARAYWVSLQRFDALSPPDLKHRLQSAYDLILAKLSKKARLALR